LGVIPTFLSFNAFLSFQTERSFFVIPSQRGGISFFSEGRDPSLMLRVTVWAFRVTESCHSERS